MLTCLKAESAKATTTLDANQRQGRWFPLTSVCFGQRGWITAMYGRHQLSDELHALQSDVSRLIYTTGDGIVDAANNHTEVLADQIKAVLSELGETLSEEEDHVEKLIAERPITSMASAFALGVVIGFMLRRH
jgi:ElaB/YqjD/DUF883 family membrane-anchored ribosome-binding protein